MTRLNLTLLLAAGALSLEDRIEALHVATLRHKPTGREYDARGDPEAQRLADVYWMLLNRPEFRVNP